MRFLILHIVPLAAGLFLSACAGVPAAGSEREIDAIVVTFSPSGALDTGGVRTVEITDTATIDLWVAALDAVPELPDRGIRYIKFATPTSEHRIELRSGGETRRVARMRSGHLDVAAHQGWAFYSGEDAAFTALVNAVLPGE